MVRESTVQIDQSLVSLAPLETLTIFFMVCLVAGLVIASPWVFYQIWAFVAAGLYRHERSYVTKYLPFSLGLFLAGVFLCFLFVLPITLKFLLQFNVWLGVAPTLRLSDWMGFATILPLVFGISFQTPLVMLFLEQDRHLHGRGFPGQAEDRDLDHHDHGRRDHAGTGPVQHGSAGDPDDLAVRAGDPDDCQRPSQGDRLTIDRSAKRGFATMTPPGPGKVYLVGAGPGDPGLLTRRGEALLAKADVVVYDHLASSRLLDLAPERALRICAGKSIGHCTLTQEEINELLIEHARAGRQVVRLKGGDPFVFGRGAEEALALGAAGIPFEIVPGVTAGVGVTAYAGIPVTHRAAASAVAFVTGHGDPESETGRKPAGLGGAGTISRARW